MSILSTKDLPDQWRLLLQWGPCFCLELDGETCPSCANAERITAAGLDWSEEYEKAIEAGDAILFLRARAERAEWVAFGPAVRPKKYQVRWRRKSLDLTQARLAQIAQVHVNVIGRIERGIYNPSVTVLCWIAAALRRQALSGPSLYQRLNASDY